MKYLFLFRDMNREMIKVLNEIDTESEFDDLGLLRWHSLLKQE